VTGNHHGILTPITNTRPVLKNPLTALEGTVEVDVLKLNINHPGPEALHQITYELSPAFRGFHIPTGNYGAADDQDSVAQKLIEIDLVTTLKTYESPIALFEDSTIRPFDVSNPVACAKFLIFDAVKCSSKLNFALSRSTKGRLLSAWRCKSFWRLARRNVRTCDQQAGIRQE
jgi:hypothetical protein